MQRHELEQLVGDSPLPQPSEGVDTSNIDKWREDFRKDIRTDIDKMCSIHQLMLEHQVMKYAPDETKSEYYETVAKLAMQNGIEAVGGGNAACRVGEEDRKKLELTRKEVELEEEDY